MQNTPPAENAPGSDTPLYAREFPGFELDFDLPEGFEDSSWHNNETPSFDKVQPDGTILKLWVDYADRSKSTLPEDEPYFRFSLARYSADQALARISGQNVISEAIAAFYDALIQPDGEFDAEIEALIARRPIAVMDMGGKTTDLVVVAEHGSSVYKDQSGTKDIGVLQLLDQVAESIKSEFRLNDNPPLPHVEEACRTKKYELFGEEVDVSHIVTAACESYLERVKNFFVSKLRDGSTVGAVIFVGGGTALIQSILGPAAFASIYKGKRFIAKDPAYANARGMWKFGTYILDAAERTIEAPAATKGAPAKSTRASAVESA